MKFEKQPTACKGTVLNLTIDSGIFARTYKLRKKLGLRFEQDVIRLALASFLDKNDVQQLSQSEIDEIMLTMKNQ